MIKTNLEKASDELGDSIAKEIKRLAKKYNISIKDLVDELPCIADGFMMFNN